MSNITFKEALEIYFEELINTYELQFEQNKFVLWHLANCTIKRNRYYNIRTFTSAGIVEYTTENLNESKHLKSKEFIKAAQEAVRNYKATNNTATRAELIELISEPYKALREKELILELTGLEENLLRTV